MTILWVGLFISCLIGTAAASGQAVASALRIADRSRLSPAAIGLTVMSIGTDLPEIANSLVSTASGHGDLNVGDSMGSVVTQVTLVLGLLCFMNSKITAEKSFVISVGTAAFFASVVVWLMVQDGNLTRLDGSVLIVLWLGGTLLLGHQELRPKESLTSSGGAAAKDVLQTFLWLGLVGVLATGVVQSFIRLSEQFGIPEFIGGFVVLSIGTSLPELVVDFTAIRKQASSMAVGDVFGSSFVDATLSIGIGPAVFASTVSDSVSTGVALTAIGVLLATVLAGRARKYDWRLGVMLIGVYAAVQVTLALSEGGLGS